MNYPEKTSVSMPTARPECFAAEICASILSECAYGAVSGINEQGEA